MAVLGDSQFRLGRYEDAIATLKRATVRLEQNPTQSPELPARIAVRMSYAYAQLGDFKAARTAAGRALELCGSSFAPACASALEALAESYYFDNRYDQARPLYERAIRIRTKLQGPLHPNVTESLNALGNISYATNDPASAEKYFRRVVANDEAVLGAEHPDLAVTINNLARVLLEQRKFVEAGALLPRAIGITLKQRDETHNDLAFMFDNLGIVKRNLGQTAEAEILFRKALRASKIHKHRNTAPVMTDLAELMCEIGRGRDGLAMLVEAKPIMAKTYSESPWRMAWLNTVQGECLVSTGQVREGMSLIISNAKVVQARWSVNSLYGYAVSNQLSRSRS